MKMRTVIKKARSVQEAARAAGDLQTSNRIHFLVYLLEKAHDNNPATLEQLRDLCREARR